MLSVGKYRGLQQCSTQNNALAVFALDHRNNLRRSLNPEDPDAVTDAQMAAFKVEVARAVSPAASAILLDPEVGAAQCIAAGAIPGGCGLVGAIESTGYTGDPNERGSQVLPGWSVEKSCRMGANAIKLLIYYHPDSPTASEIENLIEQVGQESIRHDIPFFLEPLSYSLNPDEKKPAPEEWHYVVTETARRLTPIPGVDILKAEFPLNAKTNPDEGEWKDACAELTSASAVPWILLSASVDFETYLRQVAIACQQGATGVAVGRAVWKEAVGLKGEARRTFLEETASLRMDRITALCDALAKPWSDHHDAPEISDNWHETY